MSYCTLYRMYYIEYSTLLHNMHDAKRATNDLIPDVVHNGRGGTVDTRQ